VGYSLQTSSTATSGARGASGDITGGGTAFNIGGINLGTQYPSAATAGGGVASPGDGGLPGENWTPYLIAGGAAVLALLAVLLIRK
jgi:hypothetical protein